MATDIPYRSIPDMFFQRVAASPDRDALGYPGPDGQPGWLSWSQVKQRATAIAAGLIGLGVAPEDRVAILASTRLEWVLTDFGIMCAGAATTTVYPTTEPDEASYIVADSGSRVVIAEDPAQAAKVSHLTLDHVVLIEGTGEGTLSLAELERRGVEALAADPELVDRVVAQVRPDQLATLIYTSGTTGRPKGVELLHRGWCWEGVAQVENELLLPEDLHFLWLPLSHSFGKTLVCGFTHAGIPTYVDGRVDQIVANLAVVRPTLMCAAPRIFEKVYNAAVGAAQASPVKAKIFAWAVRIGKQAVAHEQAGRPVPAALAAQRRVADRLVFAKLRARLGGRIRVLVSGSAPLSKEISQFFAAAGLPILEGYGLTETSAGNFVNRPGKLHIGTVGTRLGDLECRIAQDGEVLLRGAPVMRGYHNLPEETAAAFTEDGFFRTGDIGELGADGYLKITDRKKDLIKTSGGKYVAPSHIEGRFKAVCPYVSQVLVIGQARNYCTMLVTLDPDAIATWAAGGPLDGRPYHEIAASAQAHELVTAAVTELNAKLNRWETIKKFTILPRDLSIEDGELTPSLKVKRRIVEKSFADRIDEMYAGTVAEV
ncbi:MAG: long-chain acyl-CoA synthetase [Micromonosporaceae bacterium]